jgi:hypothetical protein
MPEVEPRILAAWREWLAALASDPSAAIAAAQVYGELSPDGRDAWLDALEEDLPMLGVPRVALYAPLLTMEHEKDRLERIRRALGEDVSPPSARNTWAIRGVASDRTRVALLVAPLYAEFVQMLSCRYSPHEGFVWVRHEPILRASDAPLAGALVDGVELEPTPLKPVVEELALAVLAQRRRGADLPSPMVGFADLFAAKIDGDTVS